MLACQLHCLSQAQWAYLGTYLLHFIHTLMLQNLYLSQDKTFKTAKTWVTYVSKITSGHEKGKKLMYFHLQSLHFTIAVSVNDNCDLTCLLCGV